MTGEGSSLDISRPFLVPLGRPVLLSNGVRIREMAPGKWMGSLPSPVASAVLDALAGPRNVDAFVAEAQRLGGSEADVDFLVTSGLAVRLGGEVKNDLRALKGRVFSSDAEVVLPTPGSRYLLRMPDGREREVDDVIATLILSGKVGVDAATALREEAASVWAGQRGWRVEPHLDAVVRRMTQHLDLLDDGWIYLGPAQTTHPAPGKTVAGFIGFLAVSVVVGVGVVLGLNHVMGRTATVNPVITGIVALVAMWVVRALVRWRRG